MGLSYIWREETIQQKTIEVLLLLFSCQVMSDSLWPHELHHARLPCTSLSPGVCSHLYSLSQWCHPTILSVVTPFSCPQSFPESGSFPMNKLFDIGASASASVHPMNIQDWGLIISYYWKNMKHKSLTLGILYSIFINLVLFLLFK